MPRQAKTRREKRLVRHRRTRELVGGEPGRPRFAVYRSLNHIYAQVIDDTRCVANQVITAAIVFEIVVATKPTNLYYLSATPRAYTRPARAVHP